ERGRPRRRRRVPGGSAGWRGRGRRRPRPARPETPEDLARLTDEACRTSERAENLRQPESLGFARRGGVPKKLVMARRQIPDVLADPRGTDKPAEDVWEPLVPTLCRRADRPRSAGRRTAVARLYLRLSV